MRTSSFVRHPRLHFAVIALLLLGAPTSDAGFPNCSVNCVTGASGKVCDVALTESPCAAAGLNLCTAYPASQTMVTTMVLDSSNANCLVGAAEDSMAVASHMAGSAVPASCQFRFRVGRCSSGACTAAFAVSSLCTVTDADGLPVELMDFSVEASDESDDEPDE